MVTVGGGGGVKCTYLNVPGMITCTPLLLHLHSNNIPKSVSSRNVLSPMSLIETEPDADVQGKRFVNPLTCKIVLRHIGTACVGTRGSFEYNP